VNPKAKETLSSLGLLALRLGAGGSLLHFHGWDKLVHFSARAQRFADPLHVGAPASLAMAVLAEVFCALAVALGFATRLAALVVAFLFGVIVFVVDAGKPWDDRELGAIYGIAFLALALLGPGRLSIDAWIGKKLGGGKGRA
jgi:putative oxidoreductase